MPTRFDFSQIASICAVLGLVAFAVPERASAQPAEPDAAVLTLPAVDLFEARLDDEERVKSGGVPHYAAILKVDVDPWHYGAWQPEHRGRARWQLMLHSRGALALSLAFSRFALPEGAHLSVRSSSEAVRPFGAEDQDEHGQLWTPPMNGDRLWLELDVPIDSLDRVDLRLTRIHHAYAGFGERDAEKAGPCHLDPTCFDSEWSRASRSVALLSVEGVRYCTGFLVNNTAADATPYLLTARHCGVTARNAASVVVMWRHERETCDASAAPPEPSRWFQTGATLRASHTAADITLLELDDPPPAGAEVVFAGWDRAEEPPREATSIHHPNTGRKRIAFAEGPLHATRHLGRVEVPGGDHLRVAAWSKGTTEGGSSGAPLFNEDQRVVGLLHGGYAACGNHDADWFGRLAAAWHGPSASLRLRDWLDPLDLQSLVLDALDPVAQTE